MKKLIATCILLASVTAVSFAQSTATKATAPAATATSQSAYPNITMSKPSNEPAKAAEKMAKASQKQYGLNDEQYKGVYDAELYYAKQMHEFNTYKLQPSEGQALQMRLAKDWGYKRALTAEQYAMYTAAQPKQ